MLKAALDEGQSPSEEPLISIDKDRVAA